MKLTHPAIVWSLTLRGMMKQSLNSRADVARRMGRAILARRPRRHGRAFSRRARGRDPERFGLSDAQQTDDPRTFRVEIEAELEAGNYLVSWTAAPVGDHGGRGRYRFKVGQ